MEKCILTWLKVRGFRHLSYNSKVTISILDTIILTAVLSTKEAQRLSLIGHYLEWEVISEQVPKRDDEVSFLDNVKFTL